jgi:hypothetical protein
MYIRRREDGTWDLDMVKNEDGTYTAKLNPVEGICHRPQYRYEREIVEREVARHNANGGVLCELGTPVRNGTQMDNQVWEDRLFTIVGGRVCGKLTNLRIVEDEGREIVIGTFTVQGPMAEYAQKILDQENTKKSRPYHMHHRTPFRGFRPYKVGEPYFVENIVTWDFQPI